jgi:beta-N-acetylhexosaminidase
MKQDTGSAELGQLLLLAAQAKTMNAEVRGLIETYRPAGFSLFRPFNVENPEQLRALTTAMQAAAAELGLAPLLLAADQEGGQLMAVAPGTTQLPGNLALGAVNDLDLAFRAGQVLGRELAAVGVNVNYAPCADVNINPRNPVIGTRSFGEDPQKVGALAAALTRGIQSVGVAATVKHFPGHGDTASDSHHGVPQVPHSLERLQAVELPPFQQVLEAGVQLVMTCHLALPAITGREDLPATLSKRVLTQLLRQEMGFRGVIVTDALDMHAIRQGEALGMEAVAALQAGADLLLTMSEAQDRDRVYRGLQQAYNREILTTKKVKAALGRVAALKTWVSTYFVQPELAVVNCAQHRAVAQEIAERSITLVRDEQGLLPLRVASHQRVLVLMPNPRDLTPADTSSYESPSLKNWLAGRLPEVEELRYDSQPESAEIAALVERARQVDLVIVGTINAYDQPGQGELVNSLAALQKPLIVVALRMPYDLAFFPQVGTYLCTYSVLPPSMQALARVLLGEIPTLGKLPVKI